MVFVPSNWNKAQVNNRKVPFFYLGNPKSVHNFYFTFIFLKNTHTYERKVHSSVKIHFPKFCHFERKNFLVVVVALQIRFAFYFMCFPFINTFKSNSLLLLALVTKQTTLETLFSCKVNTRQSLLHARAVETSHARKLSQLLTL